MINKKFGIDKKIVFETPIENYPPFVTLYSQHSRCKIALHGAHVLSFIPNGSEDILWLSSKAIYQNDKAIRGGIPLCLPWFGGADTPSHGFARVSKWEVLQSGVDENGSPYICLRLESDDWDYKFSAQLFIEVSDVLKLELTMKNLDEKAFTFTQALHTYFNISDVKNISLIGLDGVKYIDSLDRNIEKIQHGAIAIDAEIDRIYQDTEDKCIIDDKGFNRKISIKKVNSKSTVVWNPWIEKSASMVDFDESGYQKMLCVESANIGKEEITLQSGEQHVMKVFISI
jgi:glucose-6-phosphate 1-epimerase